MDLLIEQVEFCDVIVLNKTDLANAEQLAELQAILRSLNPRADRLQRIRPRTAGSRARHRPLRLRSRRRSAGLAGGAARRTPAGNRSLRHRQLRLPRAAAVPPQRLWQWMGREWPGVVRSKGYFWLASRPQFAGLWSQAGAVARHSCAGLWWAALDREEWPADEDSLALIRSRWQEPFGDRQQELVLIGMAMDRQALVAAFDACLLSDAEMARGMAAWQTLDDPFRSGRLTRKKPAFEQPSGRPHAARSVIIGGLRNPPFFSR
ncbi:GTP-binding protein [Chromobacterium sp. IIBBL 290-4]|uniref:GTP-binding protein n=1 Tax=Chromobacterium sp. IIBBL 290-4 TaxID=2953890 RepID=UPI0020B80BA5|nr:GTP-binding protein [Chromobacterium sp. IIBBL 290-4]UTH74541.1 GTP-binding protein [Chromobacterium sp. IIBBL 290-4]